MNKPAKASILISASTYPISNEDATPRFVHELAKRLKSKYRVFVLAPALPGSVNISRFDGVCVIRHQYFFKNWQVLTHRNGMLDNLKHNRFLYALVPFLVASQILALRCLTNRIRPSLINAHWIYPQGLAARLSMLFNWVKCPLVVSVHGGDIYSLKKLNFLKRWILKGSQLTLLVGKNMLGFAEVDLRLPRQHLAVRSMGVDLQEKFRLLTPLSERKGEFIYVGRIAEKKGIPTLIEACEQLLKLREDFTVSIVGGGDKLEAYREQVFAKNLSNNVIFMGKMNHNQLPQQLNAHKFFLFPSIVTSSGDQEGMPLSPVEAQGCSCVVISSDNPAAHEYIESGVSGLLFRMGDSNALANVMNQALNLSDEERRKLAESGRSHALKHFDWQRVCDDYFDHFSRAITSRSEGRQK